MKIGKPTSEVPDARKSAIHSDIFVIQEAMAHLNGDYLPVTFDTISEVTNRAIRLRQMGYEVARRGMTLYVSHKNGVNGPEDGP